MPEELYKQLKIIAESSHPLDGLIEFLKDNKPDTLRTSSQNNAIHLYLSKIAKQLEEEGHTMQDVIKAIKKAEIIPTTNALKEIVWKPIQQLMFKEKSTRKLKKIGQIEKVHMVVDKFFSDNFNGVTHPFPNDEKRQKEKIAPMQPLQIDYPEMTKKPTI